MREKDCKHEWIMTPWNPTFTDPGYRLYACLQCGSDFSAKEIEEGSQRKVLDPSLRFTMKLEDQEMKGDEPE